MRKPLPSRGGHLPPVVAARVLARWLSVGAVVLIGCKAGPSLATDYGQTARENFELATAEFEDRDWEQSITYADFVRIRFPFSRYAVEAELLIARAQFEQGNYVTAQDAFKLFAKLHPTHKHVRNGWATYMVAASAYMDAPEKFFILPPSEQRDLSQLKEALTELNLFFERYEQSIMQDKALKLRDEVKRRLLEHELYVARFYLDRDKPEAAIGRLESAHRTYPGIGLDAEVLFLLGITYLRMDEIELARATFSELRTQHPKHHHGKQAGVYLRYIHKRHGPANPARPRPDRSLPTPDVPPEPHNPKSPARPAQGHPTAAQPLFTTPPAGRT